MTHKLNDLLMRMVEAEASDLYLAVESHPMIAVHGKLERAAEGVLLPDDTASLARQALDDGQWNEFKESLEINVAHKVNGNRFRLNIYHQRGTVALVARLIRQNILSFEQLGLPEVLKKLVMAERGIVLVTGATGSGKSTTLATMVDYRNMNSSGHIVTIEDPIEFVHDHKNCVVSQREVGIDTKTFAEAIRSSLRQAPKVILIGEIRDRDTASFALHASDTGHLVLSTLHTNNANQTLERLVNMFPQEYERQILMQLSMNLRAIISQRLVPRNSGGRAAALEILINSPRAQELIQQGNVQELKGVMAKGVAEGMQTFDMALLGLVQGGVITDETALKFADSANDLKLRMRGFGGTGLA